MPPLRLTLASSLLTLLTACVPGKPAEDDDRVDSAILLVDMDGDGVSAEDDCDDNNPEIYPDGVEVCDAIDNNCDGSIDEGALLTFYDDGDGDGYGLAEVQACEAPVGSVPIGGDCDDADPSLSPEDYDADGVSSCGGDCDDNNENLTDRCAYTTMDGQFDVISGGCTYTLEGFTVDGSTLCPACDFSFETVGTETGGTGCLSEFEAILGYDRSLGALSFQLYEGPGRYTDVGKFPASISYGVDYDVLTFYGYGTTSYVYGGALNLRP